MRDMYQQHVRVRSQPQLQQPPVDGRMPTNPQPIPPSGISPHHRPTFQGQGGSRSFPNYSPSQSPHQGAGSPFLQSHVTSGEMNRSHVATVAAPTKAHPNGTPALYYPNPTMAQYPSQVPTYNMPANKYTQPSNPTTQFQGVPQSTPPPMLPSNYPMGQQYMSRIPNVPRFVSPNQGGSMMSQQHSQMQAPSPTYYHPPAAVYQSPLPTHPQYSFENMGFQSQPQAMMPQNPTPQQQQPPKRNKIIIKDPTTGLDITNSLLASKSQESPSAPNASAAQSPSVVKITKPQDQIAAQFAAQVAAVATSQPVTNHSKVKKNEEQLENSTETKTLGNPSSDKTEQKAASPVLPPSKTEISDQASSNVDKGPSQAIAKKPESKADTLENGHTNVTEPLEEPEIVPPAKTKAPSPKPVETEPQAVEPAAVDTETTEEIEKITDAISPSPPQTEAPKESQAATTVSVDPASPKPSIPSLPSIEVIAPSPESHVIAVDKEEPKMDPKINSIEQEAPKSTPSPHAATPKVVEEKEAPPVNTVEADEEPEQTKVSEEIPAPIESSEATKDELLNDEDASEDDLKKVYDRDFLIQFRFHESAMEKPKGLLNIEDIVMDRPISKASMASMDSPGVFRGMDRPGSDFTPKYMSSAGGGGGGGHGRSSSQNTRSGRPRAGGYPHGGYPHMQAGGAPKVIKKVSIQREKEPELQRAKNAWKPNKSEPKKPSTDDPVALENFKSEEILRNVRSILNKLTPQNFQSLMQKFQRLEINTEARLRGVIDLIFEKAIDEPNFCEAYSNMCRVMAQFRVASTPNQPGSTQVVEFRKLLLHRCQKEFEKDRSNEEALKVLREKLESSTNADEKQAIKDELEAAETKERRRMLGNIRFIGELFKLQMLTESIMHNCIMSLFRAKDADSLESLCRLLSTIGKDLDHPKGQARVDQYFKQMEKCISERKTSSRVRFMLQDVIDLRLNKWVPRAVQTQGPKTIDQIHADAKEEKEMIAYQAQVAAATASSSTPGSKTQSRGGRVGSRGGGGHAGGDEGWTKVQQKTIRYDPNKMKLTKAQFDETTVTLGPTRGKSGWKSGSGSSATTKVGSGGFSNRESQDSTTPRSSTPTTMNRFSALGGHAAPDATSPYNQRRVPSRHSSRDGSRSGSRSGSTGNTGRTSSRDEKQALLDTTRRLTAQDNKPKPTAEPVSTPKLSETQMETKSKSILEEYLDIVDIKEAQECYVELDAPPSYAHIFVQKGLDLSLEKSEKARTNVGNLLVKFLTSRTISLDEFIKGSLPVITNAVDLEIDLPKIWSCLAQQIVPVLMSPDTGLNLSHLPMLSGVLLEDERGDIFVAEALKLFISLSSIDLVLGEWNNHKLDWSMFSSFKGEKLTDFLNKHGLTSFSKQDDELSSFQKSISRQLDLDLTTDQNFDWIEGAFTEDQRTSINFIRALVVAVCQKAIFHGDKGNLEVDVAVIKKHVLVLRKFVDTEPKELQAVFALQRLWMELEQPPNLLKFLFNHLYDEEVISEQTFFKWESDDDPSEAEGKGVARASVNPFFTWLREADPESDE